MLAATECSKHKSRLPEPSQNDSTTPRVLTIISFVLEKLVARNDRLADILNQQLTNINEYARLGESLKAFHGVRAPHISIAKYLERLLVTSVLVASKMMDDVHYNNAFYAPVGGVSNAELNRLELELLFLLDFLVTISSRVLEKEMLVKGTVHPQNEKGLIYNSADDVAEVSVENRGKITHAAHLRELLPSLK